MFFRFNESSYLMCNRKNEGRTLNMVIIAIVFLIVFSDEIIDGAVAMKNWYCYGDALDKREAVETIALIVITIAVVAFCVINPKI